MRRVLGAALALCLTVGLLAGCGGQEAGGEKVPMGRYIEEQGQTLEGVKRVWDLRKTDGGETVFYGRRTDSESFETTVERYVVPAGAMEAQGTAVDWLSALPSLRSVSEGPDGTVYALYLDDQMNHHLARSAPGGAPEEIEMPEWAQAAGPTEVSPSVSLDDLPLGDAAPEDDVTYGAEDRAAEGSAGGSFSVSGDSVFVSGEEGKYPSGVIALSDGFLILYGEQGAARYTADGVLAVEYPGSALESGCAVQGDRLVMTGADGGEILLYSLENARLEGGGAYDGLTYFTRVGVDGDGLYLADTTGIYRQAEGGSLWEKLVDGDLTSLSMPILSLSALTSDGAEGFLTLLGSEEAVQLMRYRFDPDTPSVPDTELTIFALQNNNTVRQAIGTFQRRNPNVRVNLRVGLSEDSAATAEDVIRALNTELLGGKGPDLLLLDGLPVDSYIEKGVLADLTGLVNARTAGGDLMEHLLGAWERDGKLYGVPTRFSLPVMMGRESDLEGLTSLETLRAAVEAGQGGEPPLLRAPDGLWTNETGMVMDYYDACARLWVRSGGGVDEAALAAWLEDMAALDAAVKEHTPEQGGSASISIVATAGSASGFELMDMGPHDLRSGSALVHLQNLSGLMNLKSISDNVGALEGGTLSTLFGGDGYYPMGGIGVVAGSERRELAEVFVDLLLSPEIQDCYLYDGFPVDASSLEKVLRGALDGSDDMGFPELCAGLSTPLTVDQVVKEAVRAQVKDLLAGTITPQEAARRVAEETELYFAE